MAPVNKMAPQAQKRRRVEDESRPKKKKVHIKKQKLYHSSSEESEDENATHPRASDAPKDFVRPPREPIETGANATVVKPKLVPSAKEDAPKAAVSTVVVGSTTSKPKSILKRSLPTPQPPSEASGSGHESEDETDVEINDLDVNTALNALQEASSSADDMEEDGDEPALDGDDGEDGEALSISGSSAEEDDDEEDEEEESTTSLNPHSKKKRNDPTAFATSITKILSTKLSTTKRSDPVLSRSKSATEANRAIADSKLESKARAQIRAEKLAAKEKGRVKDVLGLETPDVDTGAIQAEEKRLLKTAQRGVVKLFNAVRAAQVKAEDAQRVARESGVVGMKKREERVNEMSKQGFLDLISQGGNQKAVVEA